MKSTAVSIVQTLQKKGFEAYFVGGCVRDMILGITPKDIDIATSARPDEIEDVFERTYAIGKKFGVILIEEKGHKFEVATFRSDSGYSDGRRPDFVTFSSPEADAQRRDFTINGIFYDPIKDTYLDFVDGMSDIRRGLLRFIGNPEKRIQEDFLRILRAVRFKNRFDLVYHTETEKALKKHSSLIIDISAERIIIEMEKILAHPSRKTAIEDLYYLGILQTIIPETQSMARTPQPPQYHTEGDVLTHTALVLHKMEIDECPELYWAGLFHDTGKALTTRYEDNRIRFPNHAQISERIAEAFCKKMKFSRFSRKKIAWLVGHHHLFDRYDEMKLATKLEYFDHPFFDELLKLVRADTLGCVPQEWSTHVKWLKKLDLITENYNYAHAQKILPSQQKELLTGEEIMAALNCPPGKKIADLKEKLRFAQLEGHIHTKAEAITALKAFSEME